jgi:hypothetical protein
MTSIDDLKHDVQSAQENVLRGLSPEERVRMFASVYGDHEDPTDAWEDERGDWLRESIPASSHADYRKKMLVATHLSRSATYGLHMGYMQYRLAEEKAQNELLKSLAMPEMYGGDAGEDSAVADTLDDLDLEPLDHDKTMDRARQKVETAATGLYIEFHANKRFAEEVLDVDLEAFLALSPSGWIDHVDFCAVLERAEAEGHITDPLTVEDGDDTEKMPLEDAVEHLYDECVRNWNAVEEGGV